VKSSKEELVKYRLERAWDTLDDARILADKEKWIQPSTDYTTPHIMQ
jgi:hypothetical protein